MRRVVRLHRTRQPLTRKNHRITGYCIHDYMPLSSEAPGYSTVKITDMKEHVNEMISGMRYRRQENWRMGDKLFM